MPNQFLILLILCLASGSLDAETFGLSEKKVAGWSTLELCERRARYENKQDWRKVAAVMDELATRETDAVSCREMGDAWLIEHVARPLLKKRNAALPREQIEIYEKAVDRTLEKYGRILAEAALDRACGRETGLDMEEIELYSILNIPKKYGNLVHLVTNSWRDVYAGYYAGMLTLRNYDPEVCQPDYRKRLVNVHSLVNQ